MAASGYDGSIRINTTLNTTEFNRGLTAIQTGLKGIGKMLATALSVTAVVKFGKECIELASDLAEVDNVVSKSFGNLRGQMDALADESIKTLGMSRLTAYQTGATFMSMGKAMMDDQQAAADMAIELTKLTGNMASFYNKSQDLVSIALKSVYTGETETLKQYGIVMTEVNLKQFALEQGITKSYSAMTQAEKVMLRYQYVMKQTAFIGEDFVDTQNSWANQTRILQEQWKEFMTILGNGLITVLTPVVQVLNKIVASLITLGNTISKVMSSIFGIKMQTLSAGADSAADSYEDAADAATDLADATTEAGEAAEGATASFDDLNVLQMDSGSGTGTGAGGSGLDIDTDITTLEEDVSEEPNFTWIDRLMEKLNELKALFKGGFDLSAFKLDLSDRFKNLLKSIESIKKSLSDIFNDPEVLNAADKFINSLTFALGQMTASAISIGLTIGENLLGGLSKYLEGNKDRIKEYLVSMFDIGGEVALQMGSFSTAFANVFSAFGEENGQTLTANIIGIFTDAYMGVTELCAKIGRDGFELLTQPFIDNQEEFKTAFDGLLEILANFYGGVKQAVDDISDTLNSTYDTYISPLIKSVTDGISTLTNSVLGLWNTYLQPFFNNLVTAVVSLWSEHLSPLFTSLMTVVGKLFAVIQMLWETLLVPVINWILQNVVPVLIEKVLPLLEDIWNNIMEGIGLISDILTVFFDMVGEVIDGFMEMFSGLIEFITGVFTGDWELAWQGVADIMQGVSDMFKGIINGIIGFIEKMVNAIIDGINAAIDKIKPLVDAASDVMGALSGGRISFNLNHMDHVSLPRLANGGITTGATLAQIGEAGREAVIPLEQNTEWMDTLANKLAGKMSGSNSNQPVYLQVDGKTFARLMNPYTDAENKRIGVSFA